MSPVVKRYRDIGIVAVLLVVPFFVLRANMKRPENLNALDRAILRVSAPIEYGASSVGRGLTNLIDDYVFLVDVKQDNQRLVYENARLREENHRLEQLEYKNRELNRLLGLRADHPDGVSAQVIGKDFTPFFRAFRLVLDRGNRDVREHMPVVAPDGVVGSVLHVSGDSVDVRLSVDAAFGLDVEDERTHARGFLQGTGDPSRYVCKVAMVDSRDEVDVDDFLVTTGRGHWFPPGLKVARVKKVLKRELGRDQEIEAEPTVDFSRLENVLILVTTPGEEPSPATASVPSSPASPRGKP